MAHVNDRGQIMIVMSLVLAVMLVMMSLYLNTAIFTENLATRQADIAGAGGALSYKAAAIEGASGALDSANRYNNSSNYDALEDRFEADVDDWSNATADLEATRARSANASVVATTPGTLIIQDDHQEFTNETGIADWRVVENTSGVRKFRMNVSGDSLGDSWPGNAPHQDDLFTVEFDDGSTERKVQIYGNQSKDNIHVTVLDGSDSELGTCTVKDEEHASVDLTGAEFDGDECEPLRFFGELDGLYNVTYNHSNNVKGTYRVIVAQHTGLFGSLVGDHYDTTTNSPYYTKALYAAKIRVTYETARIDYATVVRVAPGEPA